MQYPKTLFLHGRPGPHPCHAALARSIDADFLPVDYVLRSLDRPSSRFYRHLSGLVCGLGLLRRRCYGLILAEGSHAPPVIAKKLGLLGRNQKIAALMSSETLYFIKSGYYPPRTCRRLIKLLTCYDTLLCAGPLQVSIAEELIPAPPDGPEILQVSLGFSPERGQTLGQVIPALTSKRLLLVAHGTSEFRAWYKGLDLLFEAFALVSTTYPELELVIVGEWDREFSAGFLAKFPEISSRIMFAGSVKDLGPYISRSCLCVHLARGDAFPVSILELMASGLPTIVSEWTGTREAVEQVDPSLVVPLNAKAAAERIVRYLASPVEEKLRLSAAMRDLAIQEYTEAAAIVRFRAAVLRIFEPTAKVPVDVS